MRGIIMANKQIVFKAHLDVSDMNHHRYEHKDVTISLLPKEDIEHFLLKLIGYCLLPLESAFWSKTNDQPIHPDLGLQDEIGDYTLWIEVGFPSQKRLDKACQLAKQVVLITPKESEWLDNMKSYLRKRATKVIAIDIKFLNQLQIDISKRLDWSVIIEHNKLTISNDLGYYETSLPQDCDIVY